MESEEGFVPIYCPNCGEEVSEEDICKSCGKSVVFTIQEYNTLNKKYCHACGFPVKPNSDTCGKCGKELKISQAMIHVERGAELKREGRKVEAVAEAKKALAVEETPEGRFFICAVIVATQGDILKEKYLHKYGDLDHFPKEVIESGEFQDILKHGKQALEELNKCSSTIRQQIESDPKNNVDGIRHTVEEFSKEANNPNPPAGYASEKKGGCFIATAVYGSDTMPDVVLLREFRDTILVRSRLGRMIVNTYYYLSPPLARVISTKLLFRNLVRKFFIQPIVYICTSNMRGGIDHGIERCAVTASWQEGLAYGEHAGNKKILRCGKYSR
jgi:predicted amidophosphoribosyltransferase